MVSFSLLKKYKYIFILAFILIIGSFFRIYQISERFTFGHDADLFSWIVKDIVIDKHLRLIGQLTSAEGIYIGPLFYYALIPFFLLTKMDPIGGVILITFLGAVTAVSYYFVFSKLFNQQIGLIITFLHAVLVNIIESDRWLVPSTPTSLWSVWYFYTIINLSRGNFFVLPILGILIGLIWHIHIALIPSLLAVPVAIFLAKRLPSLKQVVMSLLLLLLTSLPLFLFEIKHNFSQTISLINNFGVNYGGGVGLLKFNLLMIKFGRNIDSLLFSPQTIPFLDHKFLPLLLLVFLASLIYLKLLKSKEVIVLISWITGIIVFYVFSSTIISEYYLSNLEVIILGIVSFWLYWIFKFSKTFKYLVIGLLGLILLKNTMFYLSNEYYQKGYLEKKAVVSYLVENAKQYHFPCVAVSYITTPGENVGFRYLFWLNNLHVNQPSSGSPVYTIVIPEELAEDTPRVKFGNIGVYGPENVGSKGQINKSCSGQNANLTDPMFSFSN